MVVNCLHLPLFWCCVRGSATTLPQPRHNPSHISLKSVYHAPFPPLAPSSQKCHPNRTHLFPCLLSPPPPLPRLKTRIRTPTRSPHPIAYRTPSVPPVLFNSFRIQVLQARYCSEVHRGACSSRHLI